ncbi:MAG: MotA/TolQ/ExbB proton channel family protein [Cyanobium sp.]
MSPAYGGPVGWLLILLSISVLTVTFERLRFWWTWWKRRNMHQQQWKEILRLGGNHPLVWLEDRDLEMRFAEPFLEAAIVIAPLLGLIGTVLGLSRLLAAMGPQLLLPSGSNLSGFADVLISTAMGLLISLLATVTLHFNNGLRNWRLSIWRRDLRRQSLGTASE